MKDSGWRFDNFYSMTIYFYKTNEMNGSNYIESTFKVKCYLEY